LRIYVNGESKEFGDGLSLLDLLHNLNLPIQRIAVELNRSVVRRAQWENTPLKDDDRIEIVHFVGGGCTSRIGKKMRVESPSNNQFSEKGGEFHVDSINDERNG
jgi:sulfur carrier protein